MFKNTSCNAMYKIFRFIKKIFFIGLTILSSFTNANSLSCISMSNQACKAGPEIINVNSNNPAFYPFSFKTNVVVIAITLMIHTQKHVFQIL